MKKLLYTIALLSSGSLMAMGAEQRISSLEKQVNAIIKNEKERTEAINKLATAVLELEKKMKSEKKISSMIETEEGE